MSDDEEIPPPIYTVNEKYRTGGAKTSLLGYDYQLKWLMLFAWQGRLKYKVRFLLATEEVDCKEWDKFDDLVFRYEEGGQIKYRYMQVKHCHTVGNKKINIDDLKSDSDANDFSLQKYFKSYLKIVYDNIFKDGEVNDLIICCNFGLNYETDKKWKDFFLEDKTKDPIFDFRGERIGKRYKFNELRIDEIIKELEPIFRKALEISKGNKGDFLNYLFRKINSANSKKFSEDYVKIDDFLKKLFLAVSRRQPSKESLEKIKKEKISNEFNLSLEKCFLSYSQCILKNESTENFFGGKIRDDPLLKLAAERLKDEQSEEKQSSFRKIASAQWKSENGGLDEIIVKFFDKLNQAVGQQSSTSLDKLQEQKISDQIKSSLLISFKSYLRKSEDEKVEDFFRKIIDEDPVLNLVGERVGELYQLGLSEENIENKIAELKPISSKALKKFYSFDDLYKVAAKEELLNECISKIGNFLGNLVFAVEQPSSERLEKEIKKKIGDEFNLINESIYYEFYRFMSSWMQDYVGHNKSVEAYFLTKDNLDQFFKKAKEKIASLACISSSILYKKKIEQNGIEFKNLNNEIETMKQFLKNELLEKQILIFYYRYASLSGIKVCQVLQNESYKEDAYIFSDLKSLSTLKNSICDPIAAFNRYKLLIIENNCKNIDDILKRFFEVIKSNHDKKIILITSVEQKDGTKEVLDEYFKELSIDKNIISIDLEDSSNKLTDLTEQSIITLLNKNDTVLFQGEEITLSKLLNNNKTIKSLISGDILCKIINDEYIEIGRKLEESKCFIDRKFIRPCIKVKQDILSEKSKFIIMKKNLKQMDDKDNRDILLISQNEHDFKKLCDVHSKKRNIHYLNNEGNDLVWRQSHGSLLKLREFIMKSDEKPDKIKPKIKNENIPLYNPNPNNDKEVIISAESGMGKTTLLTHTAWVKKKSDPSLWVIKINLADHTSELKKQVVFSDKEVAMKFLYKAAGFHSFLKKHIRETEEENKARIENFLNEITVTNNCDKISIKHERSNIDDLSLLEVKIFNDFYNQGKIMFFFDEYDVISPDYGANFKDLINFMKGSKAIIWIATRPYNINEDLENELGTISYSLKPFSKDEQEMCLKKFWALDENLANNHLSELLARYSKFTEDVESNFMSNPLHLYMFAVVHKKDFESHLSNLSKTVIQKDLYSVYKEFINFKFDNIHIGEKNPELKSTKLTIEDMVQKRKMEYLQNYRKLAAYSILGDNLVKLFLNESELHEIKKVEIKGSMKEIGIISHVVDGKPVFEHRTYAEYFLSDFIFERLTKADHSISYNKIVEFLFQKVLIKDEYRVIRRFLNCSNLNKIKSDVIKKLFKEIVEASLNSTGDHLTPLHVAAKEGLIEIVNFLLENQPEKLVLHKFAKYNSNYSRNKKKNNKLINATDGIHRTALEYSVEYKHKEIVKILLDEGAFITKKCLLTSILYFFSEQVFEILSDYIDYEKLNESFSSSTGEYPIPLDILIPYGSIVAFNMLLDKIDDVNIKSKLLHIAAMSHSVDFCSVLLEKGVNVNIGNNNGDTALHLAVGSPRIHFSYICFECYFYFKKDDSNISLSSLAKGFFENVNNHGKKLFSDVCFKGDEGDLFINDDDDKEMLLDEFRSLCEVPHDRDFHFIRLLLQNRSGRFTEGIIALSWCEDKTVNRLIEAGAKVNIENNDGNTPLHLAAQFCNTVAIKSLLNNNADISLKIKNKSGKIPIDMVRDFLRVGWGYFRYFSKFYKNITLNILKDQEIVERQDRFENPVGSDPNDHFPTTNLSDGSQL